MFRTAPRLIARPATVRAALPRSIAPARRCLSTAPPTQKSRSWKSLVARTGLAGAIIYYYNTTDVFAEEPRHPVQALPETEVESEHLPTIESISAERQQRKAVQAQLDAQAQQKAQTDAAPSEGGMGGLEEEADQQGAFNPETGEINWDCPCLGGMADGPCGDEFKAAFSCFVYSQEEPKGVNCIENFKNMQNCFRQYPEVYGSELDSDADDDDEDVKQDGRTAAPESSQAPSSAVSSNPESSSRSTSTPETGHAEKGKFASEPSSAPNSSESKPGLGLVPDSYKPAGNEPVSESEELVPKAAHDAGDAGTQRLQRK